MRRMCLVAAIAVVAAWPASASARAKVLNNLKHISLGVTVFDETYLLDLRPVPESHTLAANHFKSKGGPAYTTLYEIDYFTVAAGGGLVIADAAGERFAAFGEQLFTGTADQPTLRLGTFNFTSDRLGNPITATLTVTRVPEPGSWALLIAGFGLTGAAMRRRRITAA